MEAEQLFYKKYGNGDQALVLFHGFGQNHQIFDSWIELLANDYTIYSFDLYYHGASQRANRPLIESEWKHCFQNFLSENQIHSLVIGAFSMGGRFALLTALQYPVEVKKLILVAPDGVFRSKWYDLAVHRFTNPIFKRVMLHPTHFDRIVDISEKLQLAPGSLVRFARRELSDHPNRKRVYQSWTYFKSLLITNEKLILSLNESKIPIELILGSKDPIIPAAKVLPKLKELKYLKHHILEARHHELVDESKTLVASLLQADNS